ncbi:hypothetical protein H6501_05240 [Candidatus Woesearchaeota archaeon]|nr:hypothetical protein [Candidatus Woesearchaeota archaeon]USN44079.1 MAG: hypothetical protein H6500_06855 [Candidatus Woesearchaeota archaeon]
MRSPKKAISPVIAVALLLVVAVVAVVFFSTWFDSFRSALFAKAESDTASGQSIGIVDLVGDELFFQAGTGTAVSVVKVSGNECEFSTGEFSGLHIFDLGSCLDASGDSVEVSVVTNKQVYSQKFFVKEHYQSHELMPVLLWNVTYENPLGDFFSTSIILDSSENLYLSGRMFNGVDYDAFFMKTDPSGNELWNKSYDSGHGDDFFFNLGKDSNENIYVVGRLHNPSNMDGILIKYAQDGSEIWNLTYDGGDDDSFGAIFLDSLDNIYLGGWTHIGSDYSFLLVKSDSNGNQLWNVSYVVGAYDVLEALASDSLKNIYSIGYFDNVSSDLILVKYDSNGNRLWNVTHDMGDDEYAYRIAVDSKDSIYVTGEFKSGTYWNGIIIKYDTLGNVLWERTFEGSGTYATAFGIAVDALDNVYVGGGITKTNYGGILLKYDSLGNEVWNVTYDNGYYASYYGVSITSSGDIYVVGESDDVVDTDLLLLKYAQR